MRHRIVTTCAAAALAVAGVACGGDDSSGGGGGSLQNQVAAELIGEADVDGVGVDEACVRRATSRLSDSDARALLDDDDDALSPDGALVLFGLLECIDFDFDFDDLDLEDFDFDD